MDSIEIFKSLIYDGRLTFGYTIWHIILLVFLATLYYVMKKRISAKLGKFTLYRMLFNTAQWSSPYYADLKRGNIDSSDIKSSLQQLVSKNIVDELEDMDIGANVRGSKK